MQDASELVKEDIIYSVNVDLKSLGGKVREVEDSICLIRE